MIATGTDVRPLEVLLFMRDVKSRSYYEQMKGRGTRTCSLEELRAKGTPSAKYAKDHFVIIDAIGVEQSQKTDSRPLEKAPGVSLKEVLQRIAVGERSEEMMSTLANRLLRLDKQISAYEKQTFEEKAQGKGISEVVRQLLHAHDPDTVEILKVGILSATPDISPLELERQLQQQHQVILENAVAVFHSPELREFIIDVRRKYDQVIDSVNIDSVTRSGWVKDQVQEAEQLITDFTLWLKEHKDEITALQIFYDQPYRRRELTFKMIKDLSEEILRNKPALAPLKIWKAYEQLEQVAGQPKNELVALVSLLRRVTDVDAALTAFDKTVDKNFADWVWKKQQGATIKFNQEQMKWLHMMKEHIAASVHLNTDDLDYTPFDALGGRGKMWQLFGADMETIIEELNEVLVA
jgi:type I restriction enzyme R subunit